MQRDYLELTALDSKRCSKAVLVLSGAIIEGLLSDALIATEDWSFADVDKLNFENIIQNAQAKGVIRKADLSHILRNYRNLIHPSREIREGIEYDDADAQLARSAVEVLLREVKKWSEHWRQQLKYRAFLESASNEELLFLSMFSQPKPADPVGFEHPWIEAEVYNSRYGLVKNRVIICEPIQRRDDKYTENVILVSDAIAQIEAVVLKGKVKRTSINLSLANIAPNLLSGSGAPGSPRR